MLTAKLAHEVAMKELVQKQRASVQKQLITAVEAAVSESAMSGQFFCSLELQHSPQDTPVLAWLCKEFRDRGFYVQGSTEGHESSIELAW